jgi:hypothetical protein
VRARLDFWLEARLPNLVPAGYTVMSPKDTLYNCLAWAIQEDRNRWWEPKPEPGCFWPKAIPMTYAFENYLKVFELFGYTPCGDASLVVGFEKVAIYRASDGSFAHVARQIPTGAWISKLGQCEDIEHKSLDALTSTDYGVPSIYLQRRISTWRKIKRRLMSLLFRSRI